MIQETLKDFSSYGVACFVPLSMVIKEFSLLNDEEVKYAMNPNTHIDFLIYNKLGKQPVLAIETDGYLYHKKGTVQSERDVKKDSILKKCDVSLLRLKTNESNEQNRIIKALTQVEVQHEF